MTDNFPVWVRPEGKQAPSLTVKRHRGIVLPFRSVEDDAKALTLPGPGEAPCANGAKCTACIDIEGGPGAPLKAMHPAPECILCLRLKMRAAHIAHTVLQEPVLEDHLVQLWESPVGENGYREDYCMGPASTWNGFVSQCVFGRCSQYCWALDDSGWHINQDALLFRQAPARSRPARAGASYASSAHTAATHRNAQNTSSLRTTSRNSLPSPTPPWHHGPPQQTW